MAGGSPFDRPLGVPRATALGTVPVDRGRRATVLVTGKPSHVLRANPRTCRESFTQRQTFRVLGGQSTGEFAGTSGRAAVQIYFAAFAPRYTHGPKKGMCDFASNTPQNRGAVARFLADIVLTRHR